jgi:type IV secretory pathway VirB10-like protein
MRLSNEQQASERRRDAVRRLQVGAVGLVLIALLVGLSTLLTDEARQDSAVSTTPATDDPLTDPNAAQQAQTPAAPPPAVAARPNTETPMVPDLEPDPELRPARPR